MQHCGPHNGDGDNEDDDNSDKLKDGRDDEVSGRKHAWEKKRGVQAERERVK